ncbi:hypothetical protein D3C72_2324610 [compost metagenome]
MRPDLLCATPDADDFAICFASVAYGIRLPSDASKGAPRGVFACGANLTAGLCRHGGAEGTERALPILHRCSKSANLGLYLACFGLHV